MSRVTDLEYQTTKGANVLGKSFFGLQPKTHSETLEGLTSAFIVSGLSASSEHSWKKIKVRPDSSSQDSEVTFHSSPKKAGLGVRMAPLFEKVDSEEGCLEIGMSVDVLEQ